MSPKKTKNLLNEWTKIAFVLVAIAIMNSITADMVRRDFTETNIKAQENISNKISDINESIHNIQNLIPEDFGEFPHRKDSVIYIFRTHETINNNYPAFHYNDSASFSDNMRVIKSARYNAYKGID